MATLNVSAKVKYFFRLGKFIVLMVTALIAGLVPCNSSALEDNSKIANIWFSPRDHMPRPDYAGAPDFMKLFQQNAPWPHTASHVQVIKLSVYFVNVASDADLRAIFDGLQQRHITLAIEAGMLTSKTLCGKIEGYCGEQIGKAIARIKSLGGILGYVAMDEPLWFGHVSSLRGALHTPLADLATDVANQVAVVHQYFPNAQIGDIEPVGNAAAPADYVSEITQWAEAYKVAVGHPLAFFHSDVGWQGTGWQIQLMELYKLARTNGMKFGIIYNGNPNDFTGIQWTANAEQHFINVESGLRIVPDDAIIQTWDAQPNRALPETQPGTMTYLVERYALAETVLSAQRTQDGFDGQLTTHGMPVSNVPLSVYEIDDGTLNITSTASLQNKVPATAVTALVALRINTECKCEGPVNILLGSAQYVDNTSNQSVARTVASANERIVLTSAQTSTVNSEKFPVTAGDTFTFSVPMQVAYSSSHSGYVAIVFQSNAGVEVARMELPFQPGQKLIWAKTTNPEGRFKVKMLPPTPIPSNAKFIFSGNSSLRSSSYELMSK